MPQPTSVVDAVRALARVSRVIERAAEGLSLADYRVLSAIASGEVRASRLAAKLALGKPAISATVESLGRRGLIERSSVAGDNRAVALSLSAPGTELFERVEAQMIGKLAQLCERTPDGDQVIRSLSWLGEAVESVVAERAATETER
jgi:DNA-binding MarR family transcriptional regulator